MSYIKELKTTPDTDKLEISIPDIVDYEVEATYYIIDEQKDIADALRESIEEAGIEFVSHTRSKIGRAVNPNILVTYAGAAGASRIEIVKPAYIYIHENAVANCNNIKMTFGGFEKE